MENEIIRSNTRAASDPTKAASYIEERLNEPGMKIYGYYYFSPKEQRYLSRAFINNEGMLVNYLINNQLEKLMRLLDSCSLYRYVMRTVRHYEKAVEKQCEELCNADEEMKLALKLGNVDKYYRLKNGNRLIAEEMLRGLLYSA